jgi:hypothetical protein
VRFRDGEKKAYDGASDGDASSAAAGGAKRSVDVQDGATSARAPDGGGGVGVGDGGGTWVMITLS